MALVPMTTEDGRTIRVSPSSVGLYLRRGATVGGEDPAPSPVAETVAPVTPARSASKGDWVEHALAHGLTEDEATGFTRDELADRFGA